MNLFEELELLIEKKLVRKKHYPDLGLYIYKYDRKVFFKNLWHKSPLLLKARGLVLDENGNIVVHPFTKIFNYQENNTGRDLKPEDKLLCIEKVNGFLGCISLHNNNLLYSTTGSLDSDFVQYIKDMVDNETERKIKNYLTNNNLTLMFEVIHPQDPHIIEYKKEEQGLYLIGARGKNINEEELNEQQLDTIAQQLNIKRPNKFIFTRKELEKKLKTEKIEGYMVRDITTDKTIMKAKTSYYLTTKFLGRLNNNNIEFMFSKPNVFKEKIEEEFYPLVNYIVKNCKITDFIDKDNNEKTEKIRNIINLVEQDFLENKTKIKNEDNYFQKYLENNLEKEIECQKKRTVSINKHLTNFFNESLPLLKEYIFNCFKDVKLINGEEIKKVYICMDHDYEEQATIYFYANKPYQQEYDLFSKQNLFDGEIKNIDQLFEEIISSSLLEYYLYTYEKSEIICDFSIIKSELEKKFLIETNNNNANNLKNKTKTSKI